MQRDLYALEIQIPEFKKPKDALSRKFRKRSGQKQEGHIGTRHDSLVSTKVQTPKRVLASSVAGGPGRLPVAVARLTVTGTRERLGPVWGSETRIRRPSLDSE